MTEAETALQRAHMEALRVMINNDGPFSVKAICRRYKMKSLYRVLMALHWLRIVKGGTTWIGPKPRNETELFRLAFIVRQASETQPTKEYPMLKPIEPAPVNGATTQDLEELAEMYGPVDTTPIGPKPKPVPAPEPIAVAKPQDVEEVSVLWGLFKKRTLKTPV